MTPDPDALGLTGRISTGPAEVLRAEVLEPQLRYELRHLLPHYVAVEQVLVAEYARLGVLDAAQAAELDLLLGRVTAEGLLERRGAAMSDLAFALEQEVEAGLTRPVPAWHVDRSRNDLQACAQLMFGRQRLRQAAGQLLDFAVAVREVAAGYVETPMPGYTQHQAAQVVSPGFYLTALGAHVNHTVRRLLATYDGLDACPLGAGAMAGQELPWDRDRMARLLGFAQAGGDALSSVASRSWAVESTAELSTFGVGLSRFFTDLLTWSGAGYSFVDLPDELAGISSAMPQKRNFPVLERIRGRCAHLSSLHVDVVLGQRNTPFANTVEVSKEAGAHVGTAFATLSSVLRLGTAVFRGLRFDSDRMRAACDREFLGGFALANALCLAEGVPWRTAQVIAGRYIVGAMAAGRPPADVDPALLSAVSASAGCRLADPATILAGVFDTDVLLRRSRSAGSAHPDEVRAVLAGHAQQEGELRQQWERRAALSHPAPSGSREESMSR